MAKEDPEIVALVLTEGAAIGAVALRYTSAGAKTVIGISSSISDASTATSFAAAVAICASECCK